LAYNYDENDDEKVDEEIHAIFKVGCGEDI
jgi:hypothetical protein